MTMAPGNKKRSFWLEIAFAAILLFLLLSARTQLDQKLPGVATGLSSISSHPHFSTTAVRYQ